MLNFKTIRITLLLGVLAIAGFTSAHQLVYSRSWTKPLEAVIYPINADGHLATNSYIESLRDDTFTPIDKWLAREAARHNLDLMIPVRFRLGEQIHKHPPTFPVNGNGVDVLIWGLRFRWWAFRNTSEETRDLTRIRLFVMYHHGNDDSPLTHSLGMQKGLMGLVHAFALPEQNAQNNIVIAHEMLHTVGAIDKYESTGAPMFPIGYANPSRTPLFPQRSAEIMAGRIPTSHQSYYMAESLKSVVINGYTAAEINWLSE